MMMLKFGRVVNLDALEGLTTNKLIGELEQTLKEAERKYERAKHSLEVSFVLLFTVHKVQVEKLGHFWQNTLYCLSNFGAILKIYKKSNFDLNQLKVSTQHKYMHQKKILKNR